MNEQVRQFGFASVKKVAGFFGVSERLVRAKIASNEWPSYFISNRRILDLDEIIELVTGKASVPSEGDTERRKL
jgi:hypothetical protein